MRFSEPLLHLCAQALADVVRFDRPADAILSGFFHRHREAGRNDRALVASTVYAALRRWRLMEAISPGATNRMRVLAVWVTLLGANLRELQAVLKPSEVAWLTAVKAAAHQPQSFEVECDLPDWVISILRRRFDDAELLRHALAFQEAAPLDIRVNLLKTKREAVLAQLSSDGFEPVATPYSPAGVRLRGNPAINRHPLFLSGEIEVQDEGSQLLAWLLEPRRGEMIVDFCAGAGGKTLSIGALMRSTGRLYAFDVSARRLEKMRPRLARSGLQNVHPQRIDSERDARIKRLAGKIDRVLVDAPCSGFGTLRRNPDLKFRQTLKTVAELQSKQALILDAAAMLPKVGGRLMYATCSILPEENQETVEAFLVRHPEYRICSASEVMARQKLPVGDSGDYLELWPALHNTDGFFAALLERTG